MFASIRFVFSRQGRRMRAAARDAVRGMPAIDRLECRQVLASPAVTSLTLINSDTDQPINLTLPKNGTVTIDLKAARHLNIRADVTASKSVKFGYDGNASYHTESGAPFSFASDDKGNYFTWTPTVGTHTVSATAYASSGATGAASPVFNVTLKIVDTTGTTGGTTGGGTTGGGTTSGNTPYLTGTPAIPTNTILLVNYDYGGEGVAFHDTDAANIPGQYRANPVDVEANGDAIPSDLLNAGGAGYSLAYVRTGEWLKYTVNIATAGTYDLDLRYAAGNNGGTVHVEVDGANVTGPITLGGTGDWHTWKTAEKAGVVLPAGQHVLRLFIDTTQGGDVANLNWLRFVAASTTPPVTPPSAKVAWPSSWQQQANAPGGRFEAAYHVIDGKIFVFGGFKDSNFDVSRTYESYDPNTGQWTQLGTLPAGMAETHLGMTDDGHYIYMVGGFGGNLMHNTHPSQIASSQVWRYDPLTNHWMLFASLPSARGAGGAAVVGRRLYYTGGNPSDRVTNLSSMLWLDLDNPDAGWTYVAGQPDPKDHFSTIVIGTKIYVIGGEHGHDVLADTSKTVYVYDTATDQWTRLADMLYTDGHSEGGTSIVDGQILMAGGQDDHAQDATSRVESYNPATNKWTQLKSLPVARQGAVVAVFGNKVVLALGAQFTSGPQAGVWIGYR